MADPLREKLKALVEDWRHEAWQLTPRHMTHRLNIKHSDQLAALLAESEPAEDAKRIVAQAMNGAKVPPGYQQVRKGEV